MQHLNHCTPDGELRRFVRTQYNYDTDEASQAAITIVEGPSLTQQQFKDECDINTILRNFGVTGHLPIVATQPMVGDFTGIVDFQSALQTVQDAEDNFMALPSAVREKFLHDPAKFVDFCLDPANIEAVRDLGLAPRPAPVQQPTPGNFPDGTKPIVSPAPAGSAT